MTGVQTCALPISFGDQATYERYVSSLGNLSPLETKRNQAADRKRFPQKLECYFMNGEDSAYALTNELRGLSEWTPVSVRARHERLMALVQTIWRFGGDIRWRPAAPK